MTVKPVLEVIQTPLDRTFRIYAHDYPFVYSGWHHHPEYELHLIRRSRGHFYVGTYAGEFGPGNLVMTGPNLPHMWVSDADERDADGCIVGRDLVLQLSAGFAERCVAAFSDCCGLTGLLEASRAGIEFSSEAAAEAARLMEALLATAGLERMAVFFTLLKTLEEDRERTSLSLMGADHECAQPKRLERILAYIAENFNRPDLSCREIAEDEGMGLPAFSRLFERHVRCTCIEYINHLRIYKACQLLMETDDAITPISLEVGYDTLSTFNRNFRRLIGKTPSAFRAERRSGATAAAKSLRPPGAAGRVACIAESTSQGRGRSPLASIRPGAVPLFPYPA
ncbi:AraC family transcriptional regulator [Roseiarcus fermentans]|uniref:AraC family transcriptional regulator n=1 Tax=Roseiarcus fermentans TaxID=1473586 RepID=A0A366FBJ3_9HYPH|nr:AraC family transcriptional regulator [Roseiarcus fermentans]RBP11119.1 AraC family transcriptional regulator [Roseiarcus fermentans]